MRAEKNSATSPEERRSKLLRYITESKEPISASTLASHLGVTRQIIVQDISLLRAQKNPVISTHKGYMLQQHPVEKVDILKQVIYCKHSLEDTGKELNILVDHGITVADVGVDHTVYGKISRPLGLKSRLDVNNFLNEIRQSDASLLSSLTNGLHFHTVLGPNMEVLERACTELAKAGLLVRTK